ncbi:hypothetical protein D3C78_1384790 [compost metagenome]
MSFWSPTKRKLSTMLLLVFLWITYSAICGLTTKAYKAYSFDLLSSSNYSKGIEEPTKEYVQATQGARRDITAEMVEKLKIAGYVNASAQLALGILIAYFGSCLVHRRSSSECV